MLTVEKYGGSSVATLSKIKKIAQHLKKSVQSKNKIVVVLSAMGKTTNKLLSVAQKLSSTPQKREQDILLCTGEMVSISLLAIALNEIKVKAISLCGFQAGIKTTSNFGKAFVKEVNITKIKKLLTKFDVVIVAGFQGMDCHKNLTTLGRGGSDTTAALLAAKLKCPCNIFTDVNSIFMANPKTVKNVKPLKHVDIDSTLEIASLGAKVLDTRCLEIAKKFNVPIFLGKSLEEDKSKGSFVSMQKNFEEPKVLAICEKEDLSFFEIKNLKNLDKIFESLEKENQNVLGFQFLNNKICFAIAKNDAKKVEKTLKNTFKILNLKVYENFCMISVVGFGFSSHPQISKNMLKKLFENNIFLQAVDVSETKISMLLKQSLRQKTMQILAQHFGVINEKN